MTLVIDIGNSYTKIAVFKQDELLHAEQYQSIDTEIINRLLNDYPIKKAIISSVKKKENNGEWQTVLAEKARLTYFNTGMAGGIVNHYLTPLTLGADRLAAVIGAKYICPGKNCLGIEGGTAITYDWIDAEGNYYGGSISPGLNMRYKALNYYTSALPLLDADETFN